MSFETSAAASIRPRVLDMQASRIREVANAGLGRSDVLAFWFGESDEVTPAVIRDAAVASLHAGETFYSHNMGLPELREAIAAYTRTQHPQAQAMSASRVAVTSGGVNALMLACETLIDAGDHVVAVTPVWPNLVTQPQIMGAQVQCVSLQVVDGAWRLDLDALLAAITERTKVLIVNAPNNPTGWTLSRDEQAAILAHCRRTGTWILADEVYERLYYADDAGVAPSFLDIAEADERLIVVHSFSKSFLMTGWRMGWMVMPASVAEHVGKLIEFNTSCAPVFVQRAALTALAHADAITPRVVAHLRDCRDTLFAGLRAMPQVQLSPAQGGMYAFFKLHGHDDGVVTAKRLVTEAGLGLAPGEAFADEAAGWLRWCFASRDLDRLSQGLQRLQDWLAIPG